MSSPDKIKTGQDMAGFDQFRELANFLDGVGLPAEWSPYFQPDTENEMLDPELRDSRPESDLTAPNGRAGTPFSYWLPSAPEKSKLSEGQSEHSKFQRFLCREPLACLPHVQK